MGWMGETPVWQDPRQATPWRRVTTTARQHTPLVAFLTFACFVLLCMHLPWSSTIIDMHILRSNQNTSANNTTEAKPMPLGNGTLEIEPNTTALDKTTRFAKITVASGFEDILYEKALQTHIDHAEKWGYKLYMARENAADGMFNKVAYIMTVLLNELYKPAEERVEWLLCVLSLLPPSLPCEDVANAIPD